MAKKRKVKIWTDFPDEIEERLIQKICKKREDTEDREIEDVHISRFERFGKSGAKLLLAFFDSKPSGRPFLIKISQNKRNKHDARNEIEAVRSMARYLEDCQLPETKLFKIPGWGAVLYSHRGSVRADEAVKNPLTFRQIMYYPYAKERSKIPSGFPTTYSERTIQKCLGEVFERMKDAHNNGDTQNVIVNDHYNKYFRGKEASERISRVLGNKRGYQNIIFLGTQIINPLILRNTLPRERNIRVGRIHGDLHSDNVVLNNTLDPRLVDFGIKMPMDVFIDFVLFENSTRFWYFPHCTNWNDQGFVDEQLLNEKGYNIIKNKTFSSTTATNLYHRLACMIEVIRNKAKELLGDEFTIQKYLLTQFIVLYGLMKYDSYSPYATTRALGLIGKRLVQNGWE